MTPKKKISTVYHLSFIRWKKFTNLKIKIHYVGKAARKQALSYIAVRNTKRYILYEGKLATSNKASILKK